MIDAFCARTSGPHSANSASEACWTLMKDHPSQSEIALAAERFNERLTMLEKLSELGVEYASINIGMHKELLQNHLWDGFFIFYD